MEMKELAHQSKLTPTQQRIFDLLSDGFPHKMKHIKDLLDDELAGQSAIWRHVSALRSKLEPKGYTIACVFIRRQRMYQMFRLV